MSKNRENTTWQSRDGSWNIGFYDYYETGGHGDEDYDDEWDVEYTNDFHWVSTGHATEYDAQAAWRGANPGGGSIIPIDKTEPAANDIYDDKAAQCYDAAHRDPLYSRHLHQSATFNGKPKGRRLPYLVDDLYRAKYEAVYHKMNDYSNSPDPRIPLWQKRMDATLEKARAIDVDMINKKNEKLAQKIEVLVNDKEENLRLNRRRGFMRGVDVSDKWKRIESTRADIEALRKPFTPPPTKDTPSKTATSSRSERGQAKYHISPTTGRPNKCTATKKPCPFGGEEAHYGSKDAARKAYENKQDGSFK